MDNSEQQAFIQAPLEWRNHVLMGVPGGGKTYSIMKAVHSNSKKSLILTFSRSAAETLRRRGQNLNKNNTMTIHALAGFILSKFKDQMHGTSQIGLLPHYALRVLNTFPSEEILGRCASKLGQVQFIVVDEAQDLSEPEYNFVMALSELLNVPVTMVGDPNQSIYQFQGGSDRFMLNHPGIHIHLKQNYRSTRQIIQFVNYLRPWRALLPKMESGTNKQGPLPFIFTGSVKQVMNDLLVHIRKIPWVEREETAILSPVRESKMDQGRYRNLGLSLALNTLHSAGIQVQANYRDGKDTQEVNRTYQTCPGAVNLLTLHGSKGLEFKHVFLLNYHHTGFGITPTIEDTQRFRYLFFVGITRAQYQLRLYGLDYKHLFDDIHQVPSELYQVNQPLVQRPVQYAEPEVVQMIGVVDLIRLPEESYLDQTKLEPKLGLRITTEQIGPDMGDDLIKQSYPIMRGLIAEEIFKMEYYHQRNELEKYIKQAKKPFLRAVIIPEGLNYSFSRLVKVYPVLHSGVDRSFFDQVRDKIPLGGRDAYEYLYKITQGKPTFHVISGGNQVRDLDQYLHSLQLLEMLSSEQTDLERVLIIILVQLRRYQLEFERKDLLDDVELIRELGQDFKRLLPTIHAFLEQSPEIQSFNRYLSHPHCAINGELDVLTEEGRIVELKYSRHQECLYDYALQALIYHTIRNPYWIDRPKVEVWNLRLGMKHTIQVDGPIQSGIECIYLLVSQLNPSKVHLPLSDLRLVLDFETTGLDIEQDQIIERSLKELHTGWVVSQGLIKPDTPISNKITQLTGITNQMLSQAESSQEFVDQLKQIFQYLDQPTIIAHNGNRFDFPLLNRYLKLNYQPEDSLYVLRQYLPKGHSGKLEQIYRYYFGNGYTQTHRAEGDVDMIRQIYQQL